LEAHKALGKAEAYARLLERRLTEVVPEHPIPVTEATMGTHVGKLSKLALAAAQTLTGSNTPSKITGVAPYVLAQSAANRSTTRDQAETIKQLERGMDNKRKQLDDAVARIKEMRLALESKEKERIGALRRAEGLQQKLIGLEAEVRLAGLTPQSLGNSYRASGQLSHLPTAPGSSTMLEDHQQHPTSFSHAQLLARIDILNSELSSVAAARDKVAEALTRESQACAEAKAAVLAIECGVKEQLKKSGGMSEDSAVLWTKLARAQGELEARQRDGKTKDATISELRVKLRELTDGAVNSSSSSSIMKTTNGPTSNSSTLYSSNVISAGEVTPSRASGLGATIQVRSPVLGIISVNSHGSSNGGSNENSSNGRATTPTTSSGTAASTGELHPKPPLSRSPSPSTTSGTISRLEAEKGVLLDYIAESRDGAFQLSAQIKLLGEGKAEVEAALAKARVEVDAQARAATAAEAAAAQAGEELVAARSQLSASDAAHREVVSAYEDVARTLSSKAQDIAELTAVQEELLNAIREGKRDLSSEREAAEASAKSLAQCEVRLEAAEAALEQVEGERDALEARVRELASSLERANERAEEALRLKIEVQGKIGEAESARAAAGATIMALEARLSALELSRGELDSALCAERGILGRQSAELEGMSRRLATLDEAEAAVHKVVGGGGGGEESGGGAVKGVNSSSLSLLYPSYASPHKSKSSMRDSNASSPHEQLVREGEKRADDSKGEGVGGEESTAFALISVASRAGTSMLERAETALKWSTLPALNAAAPNAAAAARQCAGWLRAGGTLLSDTVRFCVVCFAAV